MATQPELALMAGRAYQTNRDGKNWFPVPTGWAEFSHVPNSTYPTTMGFEAAAFQSLTNPKEIVISFAGTDGLWTVDQFANFGLTTGLGADQLNQAVDYYLAVKAQNPGATITFTGHSLGGGLAALMGVFFNCTAVTFDQAPFASSARGTLIGTDVATAIRNYLASKTSLTGDMATARDGLVADLTGYLTTRGSSLTSIPRSNLVTNYRVDGEFLGAFPDASKIGIVGSLPHGSYFGPFDLHAQSLLTAFELNDGFRQATLKLTDLLAMVFDTQLFAVTDLKKQDTNFLENLLRHQIGNAPGVTTADAMLDRFTADLSKIAGTPGFAASGNLTDALIAFAMQAYYSGPKAATADAELFTQVGGGLEFLRSDVAGSLGDIKGYARYFQAFIATLPQDVQAQINAHLQDMADWYLAGNYLNATAGSQAAFMLGAALSDNLTGGSQNDLLVGLGGNDILNGGKGDDSIHAGGGQYIRHIDTAWPAEYPAGIPVPCAHGPSKSRIEREPAVANAAAAGIAVGNETMNPANRSTFSKVSRGGTPGNGAWRLAA